MPESTTNPFTPLLEALRVAPTAPGQLTAPIYPRWLLIYPPDAKAAGDKLAREVSKQGLQSLECVFSILYEALSHLSSYSSHAVLKTLQDFAANKKSGFERESAAIAFHSFATILGVPAAPLLLSSLPILFELYMDKGEVVRAAATTAVKSILKLFPAEATRTVFRKLESILENGKWRTKVGVLESFKPFVTSARDAVAAELGTTLPFVESAMHDTKQEVSHLFITILHLVSAGNPSIAPYNHVELPIDCVEHKV